MPDFLPTNDNGQLAAVEAPESPTAAQFSSIPGVGPNMSALMQSLNGGSAAPGSPMPTPVPGSPAVPPQPGVVAGPGAQPAGPAAPTDPALADLMQQLKEVEQRRKERQDRLQKALSAGALADYLPNQGKAKPSDLLRDALYNFSQLNLRNPTYGVLKGEPYIPIQQARMEQALKLHNADVQNLTQAEAMDRDQSNSIQSQLQIKRLEQKQAEDLALKNNQYQLAVQKEQDTLARAEADRKIRTITAMATAKLRDAQTARTEVQTEINKTFGGNSADFFHYFVMQHRNDPDFIEQYEAIKKALQPTKSPTGTTVFVPNQDGGYNVMRVDAGSTIPAGARTLASISSDSTFPATTKTMIANAPQVLNLVDRMDDLINLNERQLGPLGARWNEFTTGKIGVPGADYTKLRTVANLLQTKLMQMHVGARGSTQIMDHFRQLIDSGTQSPENLRAALGEIRLYAQQVAQETPPNAPTKVNQNPSSIAPPAPQATPAAAPKVGDMHGGKKVAKIEIIP